MRFLYLLFFVFYSFCLQAQSAAEDYINKFDSLALEVLNAYQIPASLVLGVALQETGAGTSKLCRINHNHFGVKWRVKSRKTKSGHMFVYRKFETDEDAYLNFGDMIAQKKYYPLLKGNLNYMKWLKAMKAAKYATSSQWISRVDKMIKRYNLTRFDTLARDVLVPIPATSDTIIILE